MDAGGLVGDDIMIGLVAERLRQGRMPDSRGYILDGFPRTVTQAEALDEIAGDKPIHVVIDLDVPREVVLQRISARRVCRDCGTNYTATGAERQPWICEVCGGDVMQRDDDTPTRSTAASTCTRPQTAPLIEHYGEPGPARRSSTASAPPTRCSAPDDVDRHRHDCGSPDAWSPSGSP